MTDYKAEAARILPCYCQKGFAVKDERHSTTCPAYYRKAVASWGEQIAAEGRADLQRHKDEIEEAGRVALRVYQKHKAEVAQLQSELAAARDENALHKEHFRRHAARERYFSDMIFQHIKHGDEKHQEWLRVELDNCVVREGEPQKRLDDLLAELATAQAQAKAARETALRECMERINNEPEYPGDMPDEMWAVIKNDRDAMTETMRLSVRLTKRNIADAVAAWVEQIAAAGRREITDLKSALETSRLCTRERDARCAQLQTDLAAAREELGELGKLRAENTFLRGAIDRENGPGVADQLAAAREENLRLRISLDATEQGGLELVYDRQIEQLQSELAALDAWGEQIAAEGRAELGRRMDTAAVHYGGVIAQLQSELAAARDAINDTLRLADNLNEYAADGAGFVEHWGERVLQAVEPLRDIEATASQILSHNRILLEANQQFLDERDAAQAQAKAAKDALELIANGTHETGWPADECGMNQVRKIAADAIAAL